MAFGWKIKVCYRKFDRNIVLYIATQTRLFFRKEAKEKTFVSDVTIVLLVIYFLTVVVFNVFFMYEHRQVNKLEKQESERILEYISKYEEETKMK